MEARYYSDKSIAVFGNTKPWTQNLKELGGRYNPNLTGGNGWIFPKTKETALRRFIDQANTGRITPLPIQPRSPSLAVAYAPQPIHSMRPSVQPVQPVQPVPSPAVRSIVQTLPSEPTSIAFPNMFVGADNLMYQIIVYTVVSPMINQLVDIQVGEYVLPYQVVAIEKQQAPFDSITIAPMDNLEQLSRAVIINGQWKIDGMTDEHSMIFK